MAKCLVMPAKPDIQLRFVSSSLPFNQSSLLCLPTWLGVEVLARQHGLGLILSATGREGHHCEPTNSRPAPAHSRCQPLTLWEAFQICSSLHTGTDLRHSSHLRCLCLWALQWDTDLCVLSLGISLGLKALKKNSFCKMALFENMLWKYQNSILNLKVIWMHVIMRGKQGN